MSLENVIRCHQCRKIFTYLGYGPELCPECRKKDEEDFTKVKSYLRENPGKTLAQTAEDCDVKIETIRQWLRDERLEYSKAGDTGITCEKCGKPIRSGHICNECRAANARMAGELSAMVAKKPVVKAPEERKDHKDQMRFLGKR